MKIWVDADGCPRDAKELVQRAAERLKVPAVFVANSDLRLPRSQFVSSVRVGSGLDVADRHIVEHAQPGDLAVTADIPCAAALVDKGVRTLDPRGEPFDADSVREKLAMRELMKDLRDGGLKAGGPSSYDARDRQRFANALDRELQRLKA